MRTHGPREENITHQDLSLGRGLGKGYLGDRGGITFSEIPDVDDKVMDTAKHHGICMYVTNLHILHMYPRA